MGETIIRIKIKAKGGVIIKISSDHQGSPPHLYCLFIASGDTGYFVWGGGGSGW